jgi:hypothetical protein
MMASSVVNVDRESRWRDSAVTMAAATAVTVALSGCSRLLGDAELLLSDPRLSEAFSGETLEDVRELLRHVALAAERLDVGVLVPASRVVERLELELEEARYASS